jgi:hypothetical protein
MRPEHELCVSCGHRSGVHGEEECYWQGCDCDGFVEESSLEDDLDWGEPVETRVEWQRLK